MSPGITFERVYRELKRRLANGMLRPGEPIEPAAMRDELAASITPIRDALHRLTGEQLVETPNHNGFQAPRLTEAQLRDLYLWNGQLLGLILRRTRADALHAIEAPAAQVASDHAIAAFFLGLATASTAGNGEQVQAIRRLNDRLAPYRRVEICLFDHLGEEQQMMENLARSAERARLSRALTRYHQARARAAPRILAAATSD